MCLAYVCGEGTFSVLVFEIPIVVVGLALSFFSFTLAVLLVNGDMRVVFIFFIEFDDGCAYNDLHQHFFVSN